MTYCFEEFAEILTTLPGSDEIWSHTAKFALDRGYSGCSLVLGKSSKAGIKSPKIMTSFSNEFQKAYLEQGLGEIDPFLLFSCRDLAAKKNCQR